MKLLLSPLAAESIALRKRVNKMVLIFGTIFFSLMAINYAIKLQVVQVPEMIATFFLFIQTLTITYFISALIVRFTGQKIASLFDENLVEKRLLAIKLYSFFVYLFATFVLLGYLGVTMQNLALIAGFLTTGFALAFRDLFLSYFVWFMLLLKKPFRIGDYIAIDGQEGYVKHIGIFYVLLVALEHHKKEYIKVPNKLFIEKHIHNYGVRMYTQQIVFPVHKGFSAKSFAKLKDELHTLSLAFPEMGSLLVQLDSTVDDVFLRVNYTVPITSRDEIKTKVMLSLVSNAGLA